MKKFLYYSILFATVIYGVVYFASCLTPYVSPEVFWPMAFLALGFPYLTIGLVVLVLLWMFIKKRTALYLFILLLCGFQNIYASIAINTHSQLSSVKDTATLRILSWNVRNFDNPATSADNPESVRRMMLNYIRESEADVLCFQEYAEYQGVGFLSNNKALNQLGYKYNYETRDRELHYNFGLLTYSSAIFSKIPLTDSGKVLLGDPSYPENIGFADLSFQNKPVRVFFTHFKSINLFNNGTVDPVNIVRFHNDSNFIYIGTPFQKLKAFGIEHAAESKIAKAFVNKSPYPVIFSVDMNSVPTSYPYHVMSYNLQDVFLKKGSGIGKSLDLTPPTLRIDFMLTDKRFLVAGYRQDTVHLSDHFPHVVDLKWKQ